MPIVHVALIRGINVGHAKRVAMADLRALVEALGYGEARTLLNSGNVVFSAPRAAYMWCPDGLMASPLAQAVGDALGDAVTMRNWTTLTKLLDLAQDRGGPRAKGARSGKG